MFASILISSIIFSLMNMAEIFSLMNSDWNYIVKFWQTFYQYKVECIFRIENHMYIQTYIIGRFHYFICVNIIRISYV